MLNNWGFGRRVDARAQEEIDLAAELEALAEATVSARL